MRLWLQGSLDSGIAGNRGRFERGGRPNGMQAWSGPSGQVALLAAAPTPNAGPALTTPAARLLSLTQFMNPADPDPDRGCIRPTSIPRTAHLGLTLTVTQAHTDPV